MYDVAIIGSGIGGLLCAAFLAKEGMQVCVIEKNKQLGGNLQTFSRNKQLFDTGVHYIGGLDKGQNLYQIFKYAGIMDALPLQKMNAAFDKILIEDDPQVYSQCQGWTEFKNVLAKDFPLEMQAIENYYLKVKEACSKFPLYHLKMDGDEMAKFAVTAESAKQVIEGLTTNKKLQAVLVGNNLLYAAVADKTPFHIHALIVNSYIESSWKCINGGASIVKLLTKELRKYKATIIKNTAVNKITEAAGNITAIELEDGSFISSHNYISAISPAATLKMLDSGLIKNTYRKRIKNLPNTCASFSLYIVVKEKTIPYENSNYYFHKNGKLWSLGAYDYKEWPLGYGLYFTEDKKNKGFVATISVLTLMQFNDVGRWADTFHTTRFEGSRGADYEAFKVNRSEKLFNLVCERFPHLRNNTKAIYAATPLTNRDYIGMEDGSVYGIQKDYNHPMQAIISPRTKIPNLFLTGQNLNLHGILGTSLSAILTCTMLLKDNTLVDKIRNA
ncbi:MAG: phytoene desaturase family protein [Niabella sp.]